MHSTGALAKPGAAIAYRGQLLFERLPTLAARSLSDAAIREVSPLVRASGKGRLYCACRGLHVRPVRLDGDRRGYVIATADTSFEALARAEAAARLVEVEVE